jgi:toxin ParE1/3/4
LEEIGDHIALDNPKRAVTFIQEIRLHCERIADGPTRYAARPELGEATRVCTHRNYLIVFEPHDDGVLIFPGICVRFVPPLLPVTTVRFAADWQAKGG